MLKLNSSLSHSKVSAINYHHSEENADRRVLHEIGKQGLQGFT